MEVPPGHCGLRANFGKVRLVRAKVPDGKCGSGDEWKRLNLNLHIIQIARPRYQTKDGPLLGPIFVWMCGYQEGSLRSTKRVSVLDARRAPRRVRIGKSRSESILPPLPNDKRVPSGALFHSPPVIARPIRLERIRTHEVRPSGRPFCLEMDTV